MTDYMVCNNFSLYKEFKADFFYFEMQDNFENFQKEFAFTMSCIRCKQTIRKTGHLDESIILRIKLQYKSIVENVMKALVLDWFRHGCFKNEWTTWQKHQNHRLLH